MYKVKVFSVFGPEEGGGAVEEACYVQMQTVLSNEADHTE